MNCAATENRKEFIERLEALRGMAAMMVAIGHCFIVLEGPEGWQRFLTKGALTVFNGRAAVTLFFVLSGFVLGLSIRRASAGFATEFIRFGVRRLFRIYPGLAGTTFLILSYLFWLHVRIEHAATTALFRGMHTTIPTWTNVWRNLLLLDFSINGVTWTLKVELLGSLLLPLVHWVSVRGSFRSKLVTMASLLFIAWFEQHRRGVGLYMFMFYLGYLLPEFGPRLFDWLERRKLGPVFVGFATLACLTARWPHTYPALSFVAEASGACGIIAGIHYGADMAVYRVLDSAAARFYGRISYSFYLLHGFTMYVICNVFLPRLSSTSLREHPLMWSLILAVVSVACATPLSWFFFRHVEKPGIECGRRILAKF